MMKQIAAAAVAASFLLPVAASAAINPGALLYGKMDQALNSAKTQVGERFTLSNVHTQDNDIHNATIYGHVTEIVRPGQGKAAHIAITYDKIRTNAGNSYALTGSTQDIKIVTNSNALKEAGGAVAGLLAGNYLGKVVGTNAGGAVGAAGGYLYAKNNRADVLIPNESQVTVKVISAVRKYAR